MSIKQKRCKSGCGRWPIMGYNGHCLECSSPEVREAKFAKLKAQREASQARQREKRIIRTLAPTKLEDKDAVRRQVELNEWFKYVATIIDGNNHCWECNEFISRSDYRNSSAHIFPKAIFFSVATHPLNFLVLGCRCGCHDRTHTIETFKKMKVWDMAVLRFAAFENNITETHKYLSLFKDAIK